MRTVKVPKLECGGGSDRGPGAVTLGLSGAPARFLQGPSGNGNEGDWPGGVCSALKNRVPLNKGAATQLRTRRESQQEGIKTTEEQKGFCFYKAAP